ncbi:MAG TPA: helix-turn-helix domain-containing protein [Pirellulales bacterium]|jgi:excisionase family DNA binding protein|nr:helix-turn-helix domain-containing protein [Pirellulales bacterium]
MSDYRRWLLTQLRFVDHIDGHPEPSMQHLDELRFIVEESERRAAAAGLPAAVSACQIRQGPITPDYTRKTLAACLGVIGPTNNESAGLPGATLTVPEVAKDLQVARDRIYEWIRNGRLEAANVNKPGARPSYRIAPEALADFKEKSKLIKTEPKSRTSKQTGVIEFF